MIPWIQVYSNILTHDKTYALAEALGVPNYGAVGLMVSLWCWASVNATDGDITRYPPRAIAEAAGWPKKADTYYNTLLEVRLIERTEEGRVVLRNWERYADLLMDMADNQKKKTAERVKRYRDKKKSVTDGNGEKPHNYSVTKENCNVTDTPCNGSTVPNRNLTVPNLSPDGESIACTTPPSPPREEKKPSKKSQPKHVHGKNGWVKLSDGEYQSLLADLGAGELERCIAYLDEATQITGNKNRWKDWNLVIRKCSRESWGGKSSGKPTANGGTVGSSYDIAELEKRLLQDFIAEG